MPAFERGGPTFNYLDKGYPLGWRPFVFQHGLGGDVSPPSRGFRLISLHCRGHGGTRGPADKLSFASFADDVVALMDNLGLKRAVVGGISMGAGVALNLASRYPKRVTGLVLSLASSQFGRPRAREYAPVLESLAGDAPGRDLAQWRDDVRVPALVLASWLDPTHPHSYAEILARALPSAQFAELSPKTEDEGRHAAAQKEAAGR